jgi:hypothetical protein
MSGAAQVPRILLWESASRQQGHERLYDADTDEILGEVWPAENLYLATGGGRDGKHRTGKYRTLEAGKRAVESWVRGWPSG